MTLLLRQKAQLAMMAPRFQTAPKGAQPMDSGTPDDAWREDCAPRRIIELFATKWTSMVLHTLHARHGGRCRSGVLLRSLPGISKKMLTQTLRDMEISGLIERRDHETTPPSVDYGLTPLGDRFVEPVEWLYDWGRRNGDALDALSVRPTSRRR
jgi:DNA-binding HxlR family transcriptional regulator